VDCHQPPEGEFDKPSEAPSLADPAIRGQIRFASREWIRSVLTGFSQHFAPLANITGENATAAQAILGGSMADWSSTNGPTLLEASNKADFDALVEFLYAQSRRPDALSPADPQVQRGKEIFQTGMLASGTVDACVDCHSMHALTIVDEKVVLEEEPLSSDLNPILTGYGSTGWLKQFIADPQKVYAGDSGNNAMPAFADQLSEHDLEMIARWLSRDYYVPPSGTSEAN
jgi:ubiquinol-cytochrome c reductase cytochrome b subunit